MRYLSFYIIFRFIFFSADLAASDNLNDSERKAKLVTAEHNIEGLKYYIGTTYRDYKKIIGNCLLEKDWTVIIIIYFLDEWKEEDKKKAILSIKRIVDLFHGRKQKKQNGNYVLAGISLREGKAEEWPSEQALEIEIEKFAQRLFKQSKWSQETWDQRVGTNKKERLKALQAIFKELIFTQDVTKKFPDFICRENGLHLGLFFDIYHKVCKEYNRIHLKLYDAVDKYIRRINLYVNGVNVVSEKNNDGIINCYFCMDNFIKNKNKFDFNKQHNNILSSHALSQFIIDAQNNNSKSLIAFNLLYADVCEFDKSLTAFTEIMSDIDEKYWPIIIDLKFNKSRTIYSESLKTLKLMIYVDIDKIKLNLDMLATHFSMIPNRAEEDKIALKNFVKVSLAKMNSLAQMKNEETIKEKEAIDACVLPSDLTSSPKLPSGFSEEASSMPIASQTTICKKLAKEQIAKELKREAARKTRNEGKQNQGKIEGSNEGEGNMDDNVLSLQINDEDTHISQHLDAYKLIEGTKIYFSLYWPVNNRQDIEFEEFFGVHEMKVLQRDSLGQSGIKIYPNFLAVKKQYAQNRLIFIAYPIDKGKYGCVFLPFKIINHREYNRWIDSPKYLQKVIKIDRDRFYVEKR